MKKILFLLFVATLAVSCVDDLDTKPEIDLTLEELLKQDPNAVNGILSRLYGSFALSGADGPGSSDIDDDAGESPFLRGIVNLQDFTADGLKNRWGDDGLDQLTTATKWDENNKFFRYMYNRIYYTIPQANNLINVLSRVEVDNKLQIEGEVRFLRALAYYYLIDCFGKGVLATEENFGQTTPLPEVSRTELYNFVESELLAVEDLLADTNSYGRADKAAAQFLLARLYMNAEVYTGTAQFDKALNYAEKVITTSGHTLASEFLQNFSGDNDTSPEIIFPLIADADVSQSYGNTTYIVNGSLSGETMTLSDYGATDGWGGHRASKGWYGLFAADAAGLAASSDKRAHLFWTDGHAYEMESYKKWSDGYPSIKFRNKAFNNPTGINTSFSGTDFPLFRLADAHLMYAEAHVHGGGGSAATALQYVNDVRARAGASAISAAELTADFILDERGRELNFEGVRRSDLIRNGKFTGGSYTWPWKGNTLNGTSIPDHYKLFPIPQRSLEANPNLTQNTGY